MTLVGRQGVPEAPDGSSGRVVVLGATGFVGRHAGAALEAAGHEVLAVARQAAKTPASWQFCPMDLVKDGPAALTRLIDAERPVAVVNAAGVAWSSSVGVMRQGNQLLVEQLLAALDAASWQPRLVHLGSVHEYTPQPAGVLLAEDSPTRPATDYGQSKLLGSQAVLRSAREGRTNAVVLRLSNVIGAGIPPGSLLGRVAQQLLVRPAPEGPVTVQLSPLRSSRDFVDAKDASEAVVAATRTPRARGRVVNIGSGTSLHVRTVVDRLIAASGRAVRLVEDTGGTVRPAADADWMCVDVTAARELLGWSPRRGLEEAVRDLWKAAERSV
ncbi:NAD-dependent epimerase/dehydratase family protein [Streptomyces sp. NPDC087843]|uniref:NAD-dependent epimerase/dehydratase family protein n=1 Tax=Streptomyces sp. NPDC087843 TaxID=3365804 RepID=UPI003810AF12